MSRFRFLLLTLFMGAGLLACAPNPQGTSQSPWDIRVQSDGNVGVMDLVLGKTRVSEVESIWRVPPQIAIFSDKRSGDDRSLSLEAFYGKLNVGGMTGRVVAPLGADEALLKAMVARSSETKASRSGAYKVILAEQDFQHALDTTLTHITFIPSFSGLDAATIEARFGKPEQRLTREDGVLLFLYPDKGLAIVNDPKGKEIFHYVLPADFGNLRSMLLTDPPEGAR